MKLSRKYKKHLKKNIATLFTTTALVTCTLAVLKLTGISVPLNRFNGQEKGIETQVENVNNLQTAENNEMMTTSNEGIAVQSEEVATANILENTDTITYIYTAQDLVDFRDSVNAGDDYAGKTVYLMDNIDLSTVCSSTLGSWVPIGETGNATKINFAGTFDGNYHTISNLYCNSSEYVYLGLFRVIATNGIVQNVILKDVNINNTYNVVDATVRTGGIVGYNSGTILNCGIESGNIITTKTSANTSSGSYPGAYSGGICSGNAGTISGCYNKATVEAYAPVRNYNEAYCGGIAASNYANIENCYNAGTVKGNSYGLMIGGVVGGMDLSKGRTGYFRNCYSYGPYTDVFSGNYGYYGGLVGRSGYSSTNYAMPVTNSYCVNNVGNYSYRYYSSGLKTSTAGRVAPDTLKTYAPTLGYAYTNDANNINNGYPVLKWEVSRYKIVENQEYIKIGQARQLTLEKIMSKPSENDQNDITWTWKSSNEDVATIDQNGVITGVGIGRTTITAYNSENNLKVKAIINVYRNVDGAITVPQVEEGNGYTVVLKEDGTVWTTGLNDKGQLGDGTTTNRNTFAQVKIDENTYLTNVKKIASSYSYTIALTVDGEVYTWGHNEYGKLAQGDTTNRPYATKVKGPNGVGEIQNIIDITAATTGSYVLNKDGIIYGAGHDAYGQISDTTANKLYLTQVTKIEDAVQITGGFAEFGALTSNAEVWVKGFNGHGEFGNGTTANTGGTYLVGTDIDEIKLSSMCFGVILKEDKTVWTTGLNNNGQLGLGDTTNRTSYTQMKFENGDEVKAKTLEAGGKNIQFIRADGKVYATGYNENGQISNGTTTNATYPTVMKNANDTEVTDAMSLITGSINGTSVNSLSVNLGIIKKDGTVWLSGDNTYGQIGNGTNTSSTYLTQMGNLKYADKKITILPSGTHQLDINKFECTSSIYVNTKNLRYTSLDEEIVTVDQNGIITAKDIQRGRTQIKVEDLDNGNETYITVKIPNQANTEDITYIYDADDLVDFRDSVNAGDDYAEKTVYLMDDIDMSTVCSETLGSWVPIGGGIDPIGFAGTFDGNYHTISNLYIVSGDYQYAGFFAKTIESAVVQNIKFNNIKVNNTRSSTNVTLTGGIIGQNNGMILNCGIESGKIESSNASGSASIGGIAAYNINGTISGCYNKPLIQVYSNSYSYIGGIVGLNYKNIEDCYNKGNLVSSAKSNNWLGGIAGGACLSTGKTGYIKNCYNLGNKTVSKGSDWSEGIVGRSGWSSTEYQMPISNCYTAENNFSGSYYYSNNSDYSKSTAGLVASAAIKTYTTKMGYEYAYDVYNINSGYPVLVWENETPVMSLNKNQAYIKVDEKLQLNVVQNEEIDKLINYNYNASNFKWTSTNEDVATVDENGVVTGLADGYTTVYAYNEEADLYAMAVINVAKYFTNPQIGTGNGFTTVLKSNGTVWAIGNNTNGQLGDGTNINAKKLVKVHIDENTELNNIVKIAVGSDHVLGLTKDGNVYAWGSNTQGELGQNDNESSNYAKLVLNEDGTGNLSDIVDISANGIRSMALDKNGNSYVWGNGTLGEIGNKAIESSKLPVKNDVDKGIKISIGCGSVGVLRSDGILWAWGRNNNGSLGINATANTSYGMKTSLNVTDFSHSGPFSAVKKINGEVYAAGYNGLGALGTGNTTNSTVYTKSTLPSIVTEGNAKVKYIEAGLSNTILLLSDGTVWETGHNVNGQLGNGTTTTSTSFVQGLTASETPLENVLTIGRNVGNINGSDSAGWGLNTAVITKDGNIYTTGDNTYGQVKSSEIKLGTSKTLYYKKMENLDIKLTYTEKNVGILPSETYQIDKNKLQYIYNNVYADIFEIKNLRYSSLNEEIVTVDQNGIITAKNIQKGTAKVKVEDLDNGYETYIVVSINGKTNTENIIYIYDIEELVDFRDTVNAGDDYAGKTVHLMVDIDMSTVCSETLGSWVPIGGGIDQIGFAGTFNGNYHTISNLYINTNKYQNEGFFWRTTATAKIENLKFKNIYINNTYNAVPIYAGGIVALNYGTISNCGIESGSVIANKPSESNGGTIHVSGGIAGHNEGPIYRCYNKAYIQASCLTGHWGDAYAGGIVGRNYAANIENCYNMGTTRSYAGHAGYQGGIAGGAYLTSGKTGDIKNCYDTGARSEEGYKSGIVGYNGWSSTYYAMPITNCYYTKASYGHTTDYKGNSSIQYSKVSEETLKTYITKLSTEYAYDVYNINSGCPVLAWENITPVMSLNKNQAYIKVDEKLQLNVVQSEEIDELIGYNYNAYNASNFKWTSTNEDVATVNENGEVTGVSDGYTTIYAYNEEADLYAMAVVNVAKYFANPQIGTGNGFTAILKADGTVWTIGNNASGQLGNGTNINTSGTVKVHIDENTGLNNIVKIAVGSDHVLALTKDGNVYAWGSNTQGQLGQNDNESSNYAKLVLNEDGTGNLSNIVDISAGTNNSVALDKDGNVYVWGIGTNGTLGNYATDSSNLPVKNTTIEKAMQVSVGNSTVSALTSDGIVWSWGYNTSGQLGINSTGNTSYPMKTTLNVTDSSRGTYHSIVKKVDGTVYGAGTNSVGHLGTGESGTNSTIYKQVNLPNTVTETNKIKYVKAGRGNSTLLLSDGTVWSTGQNTNGELGNGGTTNSSAFVQGLTASNTALENILIIGENKGKDVTGAINTGDASLNTAVIRKDGNVYTTGSNAYGQVGTTKVRKQTSYYTIMGDEPYLIYKESPVEMSSNEQYTINRNKLEYVYRSINVYEELKYQINNLKFTSLNEDIATVDQNGVITAKEVRTGVTKIKVEDVDNGYDTYITIIVNRLPNTDTMTYIYTAQDLADFRDLVNAGDDYEGKTAYVMEDIDMSTKCSEATGSWVPIGEIYSEPDSETGIVTKKYFAGTFDGNNHTISNLYIDSSEYISTGLFSRTTNTAVIKNIIMSNVNVNNTYSVATTSIYTGSIVGINRRNNFELWYKKWKHCRNKNSSKHCKWFIPCCKSRRNIRR